MPVLLPDRTAKGRGASGREPGLWEGVHPHCPTGSKGEKGKGAAASSAALLTRDSLLAPIILVQQEHTGEELQGVDWSPAL